MSLLDWWSGKPKCKRSRSWKHLRARHMEEHPICAFCGGTKKLQVHHIKPVHTHPELELHWPNLMTLCRAKKYGVDCHLFIGHLGNFKLINTRLKTTLRSLSNFKGARNEKSNRSSIIDRITGMWQKDQKGKLPRCYLD